ncbi:hypothetical protein DSM104443_01212 [Usitatibacter rugosus]|uniref:Uncharacterized protein n=1 Tax=Usitatibacter rugosus TaxID=2732067 RepID=A0A6M4GTH6_9PROT|nr:hypothetical protein [Usitatibacter rugosus]QJR10158.1 hypothetical protein DSM104443_01212 [Usitatibacter rugosus]
MNPFTWLEADMARHMLIEIPLIVAAGAYLAGFAPARVHAAIARFDAFGLAGWLFAGLVTAFWMIPAALDAAVASPAMNAAKFASLAAAGLALRSSSRRSPLVLEAFFVGNFTWMAATVGLVYQDAETRLCLAYLTDSQQRAGEGLVIVAVVAFAAWLVVRVGRGAQWDHRGHRGITEDTEKNPELGLAGSVNQRLD